MSFGIFTCSLSRAYTAMEKSNNARLYAGLMIWPAMGFAETVQERTQHNFCCQRWSSYPAEIKKKYSSYFFFKYTIALSLQAWEKV